MPHTAGTNLPRGSSLSRYLALHGADTHLSFWAEHSYLTLSRVAIPSFPNQALCLVFLFAEEAVGSSAAKPCCAAYRRHLFIVRLFALAVSCVTRSAYSSLVKAVQLYFNSIPCSNTQLPPPTKNALLSTKTKVRFLNDVCLRQMMLASPHFMANIASLRPSGATSLCEA